MKKYAEERKKRKRINIAESQYKDTGSKSAKRNKAAIDCAGRNLKTIPTEIKKNVWNNNKKNNREFCETASSAAFFLTIRKRAKNSCRTEAAVTSRGVRPDLHLVLSGSAEICQHSLVSVTLCVVTLILTTSLLDRTKPLVRTTGKQENTRWL